MNRLFSDVLHLITYPIIMTGENHGVGKWFPEFTDREFIRHFNQTNGHQKYVIHFFV